MKNMKLARIIVLSFLLFAIQIPASVNPYISKAQTISRSDLKLEGTNWRAAQLDLIYSQASDDQLWLEFACSFGKQGKVTCGVKTNLYPKLTYENRINPYTGNLETRQVDVPQRSSYKDSVGTYELNGSSIRIEISGYEINAKVGKGSMQGTITFLFESKQKARWKAEKISGGISDSSPAAEINTPKNNPEIDLNPTNVFAYQKRGDSRLRLKDYEGAISDYSKVIQLCSGMAGAKRGINDVELICYQNTGMQNQVYLNRGIARDKLGNKVGACEDYRKSCRLGNRVACEYSKKGCNQK